MTGSQPVGSAAEEAARLFAAAEEWVRTRVGDHLPPRAGDAASSAPTCAVCPLCQGIEAVRQVRPETVEHLVDAAASLVAALRSTVEGHVAPDGPPAARRAGVQRIDVQEQ